MDAILAAQQTRMKVQAQASIARRKASDKADSVLAKAEAKAGSKRMEAERQAWKSREKAEKDASDARKKAEKLAHKERIAAEKEAEKIRKKAVQDAEATREEAIERADEERDAEVLKDEVASRYANAAQAGDSEVALPINPTFFDWVSSFFVSSSNGHCSLTVVDMVHRRSSDPKIYPLLILSISLPSTVRRARSRSKGRRNQGRRNQGRRSCRRCSRRSYRRSCRCSRSYSNSSRSCCLDIVASPLWIFLFVSSSSSLS